MKFDVYIMIGDKLFYIKKKMYQFIKYIDN